MVELFARSNVSSKLEEEIFFGTIPDIDTDQLNHFFSQNDVVTIIREIITPNDQRLNDLEEDFQRLLDTYNLDPDPTDPEFGHKLFTALIEIAKTGFHEEMIQHENISAKDALDEIRRKEDKRVKDPKFVRYGKYFPVYEKDLLNDENELLSSRIKDYTDIASEFLENTSKNILIFHSPGGDGKSHILKQIAQYIKNGDLEYSVLLVKPEFPEMGRSLETELQEDKKYLLLFDDADRYESELQPLFAYAKSHPSNVKIIISSRTAGIYKIEKLLAEKRYTENTTIIKISEWNGEELKALFHLVLQENFYKREDLVLRDYSNPYLIVSIAKIIKRDPTIDGEGIQKKIISELETETIKALSPEFEEGKCRQFLADLAFLVPFRKNAEHIIQNIAKKYGISDDSVNVYIQRLIDIGVLREPGYSVRFNPDMKGDLYLANTISRINEYNVLESWIESLFGASQEIAFKNLEGAAHYCSTDNIKILFGNWTDKAIENAKNASGWERQKVLQELSRFCYLIPSESLDLLHIYLKTPCPINPESRISQFSDYETLTADDYGPIVVQLIRTALSTDEIFHLIREIYINAPDGQYDNYKIESLISDTLSPFNVSFTKIQESLKYLNENLDENDPFSVIALTTAITKSLDIQHHNTYLSSGHKVTTETVQLSASPPVIETRNLAISIIKEMLRSDSKSIRRKGIELCGNIHQPLKKTDPLLLEEFSEEHNQIISLFAELIPLESDYAVLCDIEGLLLDLWWRQYSGTEQAEELLIKFPRTEDYILYRFLFYSDIKIVEFNPDSIPTDGEERNEWYFEEAHIRRYQSSESFPEYIVDSYLCSQYYDANSVGKFLNIIQNYKVERDLERFEIDALLEIWVRKNPELFYQLRKQEKLWTEIFPQIKNTIDFQLCCHYSDYIDEFAEEIFSEIDRGIVDIGRINCFVWAISQSETEKNKADLWLDKLIKLRNTKVNESIILNLVNLSKKFEDISICVKHSMQILDRYEFSDSGLLDKFYLFIIHDIKENRIILNDESENELKNKIIKALSKIPDYSTFFNDYNAHTIQELLNYSLTDSDKILQFIRSRAEEKETNDNYHILLTSKISFLHNLNDYSEFQMVAKEIFKMLHEGKVSKYEISALLTNTSHQKDLEKNKLYLELCIEQLLKIDKIDDALIVFSALPFSKETKETIKIVLDKAYSYDREEQVKEIFHRNLFTGAYHTGENGHSPEMEKKYEFVEDLYNSAKPGAVKAFLRKVKIRINVDIEHNQKSYIDDEFDLD